MAGNVLIGILRALITAKSTEFVGEIQKASNAEKQLENQSKKTSGAFAELSAQGRRFATSFQGEKLKSTADQLAAAINQVGGASKLTETQQARANATLTEAIAKYKALGQQAPQAVIDAAKATSTLTGEFRNLMSGLGPLAPALAGVFSATAVIGFTRAIFDAADQLERLHDQTQISLRGLQQLQLSADDAGNTLEQVTQAIAQFQTRLGADKPTTEFVAALRRIGLTITEIKNLSPERQFAEIGAALNSIADPAERANVRVALFGRTGNEVAPTLAKGFDNVKDSIGLMSDETVENLDMVGDALKKLGRLALGEGANVVAGLTDILFPFRDVARTQAAVEQQLTEQMSKRKAEIEGTLGPTKALTASEADLSIAEKDLTAKVEASITANQEKIRQAKELADLFKREMAANDERIKAEDDFTKELTKRRQEQAGDREKIAQEEAKRQLEIFTQLNRSLVSLDAQRTRDLLALNPPGLADTERARLEALLTVLKPDSPEWKRVQQQLAQMGVKVGTTMGETIKENLSQSLEQLPHFLTSSLLHSGSFINGLKALGLSIADAIAEPLIRQLGKRIAAMFAGKAAAAAAGAAAGGTKWGALLGLIPGVSGDVTPTPPQNKGQPKTPTGPGIPIPPDRPGGPGRRPPPDIVNASIPLPIRSFQMGGFVPPNVVQPAVLHGGVGGELIVPMAHAGGQVQHVTRHTVVNVQGVLDPGNFVYLLRQYGLEPIGKAFVLNEGFITTNAKKGLSR